MSARGVVGEIAPLVPESVLGYVRRALGPRVAGEVADHASWEPGQVWVDQGSLLRLVAAAEERCGPAELGRRCGEELFRQGLETGLGEFIRASGSVTEACRSLVDLGTKVMAGRVLRLAEAHDGHLEIEGRYDDPTGRPRFFCDYAAGYYSQVPSLFGAMGTVVEVACQLRGAPCCRFRLAWTRDPSRPGFSDGEAQRSAARRDSMVTWFERLQEMAAELVAADDVDGVLERITGQVNGTMPAPIYVVAVRTGDRDPLKVRTLGAPDEDAEDLGHRLLRGELDGAPGAAIAEVTAGDRHFGRLAALHDPDTPITDRDRRLLDAYARHAGSALNLVAGFEQARRDRDTAHALLGLARGLAEVHTEREVAWRIAEAVPAVVDSDTSSVWLLDEALGRLCLRAWSQRGQAPRDLGPHELDVAAIPVIEELVNRPRATLLTGASLPPELAEVLSAFGVRAAAGAPIREGGRAVGFVSAGFVAEPPAGATPDVLERLTGLADHAAVALGRARLIDEMQHQARHDALTGLPNRPLVEDLGERALAAALRSGNGVGLLFVDLDRFKNVNDTLGHHAGDRLIRMVAERLAAHMRPDDTLARLGGDEFVVLLPELGSSAEATTVAERVLRALAEPFTVADHDLFVSCSIGVACSPDHGSTYEALLHHADGAMYTAKRRGRCTYSTEVAAPETPRREQLAMESRLHRAIERDELRVHYQPVVELASGRVVGAEALVRWEHPDRGRLEPADFLPLAEESGLVVAIDEWVRAQVLAQLRAWCDQGFAPRVNVNLSTRTLADPALASALGSELARAGVRPELVELEVTERVALGDDELADALARLKALGVRVAVDDFGTGHSVLRRLDHLDVDTLKLDRGFLTSVATRSRDVPLVRSVLALARNLGLTAVAEGVETEVQRSLLVRYHCERAQGFLFSGAVEAGALTEMLRAGTLVAPALRVGA